MIGKKDTHCIFEQYRKVVKEQVQDNKIEALLNSIKTSSLDPKVKNDLLKLLSDPEVAAKWKGGDADTVNSGNTEFAKELSKAKNLNADNRSGAEMLGSGKKPSEYTDIHGNAVTPPEQNDEESSKGKYNYKTGCFENESPEECQARKERQRIAKNSFASL